MVLMAPKKATFLLIVISVSLVSASSAGGDRKLMTKYVIQTGNEIKESPRKLSDKEEAFAAHPRILVVKTNDYGRYDPAPALSKPRFKLIPN